jgi:membrane-associated phospholipid phosphatase
MTEAKRVGAALWRPTLRRPSPRAITAAFVGLVYLILTVGVLSGSDIDGMDTLVFRWAGTKPWPGMYDLVSWWVLLGQRAICCAIAAVWFVWVAVRRRNLRPLLTFVVVTLLLNVTVGVVKLAIGRLGPLQLGQNAGNIGASRVFDDGTIFPSGHTSNAVVIWGLMALLAVRHRRVWAAVAGFMAVTVGLSTIYLGTHWVSDVVAGWAAGALVLLAVPSMTPVVDQLERLVARLVPGRRHRRARLFRWDQNVVLEPVPSLLGVRAQSSRPAEARLVDARWTTTDGSTRSRRLRIGDYVDPPRAAASN